MLVLKPRLIVCRLPPCSRFGRVIARQFHRLMRKAKNKPPPSAQRGLVKGLKFPKEQTFRRIFMNINGRKLFGRLHSAIEAFDISRRKTFAMRPHRSSTARHIGTLILPPSRPSQF